MTIKELQELSEERSKKWHKGLLDNWSLLEWAGAMCGEAGEAANVAKKLKRIETALPNKAAGVSIDDYDALRYKLGMECADTILYAMLVMSAAGIEAEEVIKHVFNQKSIEYGFPERL